MDCRIKYSGLQDGLHILSSSTAAGDELGWDFINNVTTSQMSITSFCFITESRYHGKKVSFMSRQTFTDWIFSWMSNFHIDFRKPCSQCQYNPPILACDGTKLGIFFKNSSVEAIEEPTCDETFRPAHRRTERQFFSYKLDADASVKKLRRLAREDLSYFVARNSNAIAECDLVIFSPCGGVDAMWGFGNFLSVCGADVMG